MISRVAGSVSTAGICATRILSQSEALSSTRTRCDATLKDDRGPPHSTPPFSNFRVLSINCEKGVSSEGALISVYTL